MKRGLGILNTDHGMVEGVLGRVGRHFKKKSFFEKEDKKEVFYEKKYHLY